MESVTFVTRAEMSVATISSMPQNDDQLTTANWLHRQHDKIMRLLVHKCEGIAYRYSYKRRHTISSRYLAQGLYNSLTVTNKYQQLDTRFIAA